MVSHRVTLSALIVFTTITQAMDKFDQDTQTLIFVSQKKAEGSYGYQGCVNKDICGMQGFYLAQYSPEGLCEKCELAKFPDRFIACLFCRRPVKKAHTDLSFSCIDCRSAAEKMLIEQLKVSDDVRHMQALQKAAFKCLVQSKQIARKSIPGLIDGKIRSAVFGAGPIFHRYLGALKLDDGSLSHVWSKELIIRADDKKLVVTRAEAEAHVQDICKRYDVFGQETDTPLATLPAEELSIFKIAQ